MRRVWTIGLLVGITVLAATMIYAGAGAVARALEGLGVAGLALLVLLHVPAVTVMGLAWWLIAGRMCNASGLKFVWARFVRDAASEVLPFSQLGGFVFGTRALRLRGAANVQAALSMSVDLVIELSAKLPYLLAGLWALSALAADATLMRPLTYVFGLSVAAVAIPLLGRRPLARALEALTRITRRWPVMALDKERGAGYPINAMLDALLRRRARLRAAFALHAVSWVYGAAELWVIFALLGHPISALEALAIDSVVAGLRSFAFAVPMAAGVQEASYVLVCAVLGISPAVAVAASFARRARDLTLGGLVLLLSFGVEGRTGAAMPAEACRSRSRG